MAITLIRRQLSYLLLSIMRLPRSSYITITCLCLLLIILACCGRRPANTTTLTPYHKPQTFSNFAFRQQLIDQRLASHARFYDDSLGVCNITGALTKDQENAFSHISQLLVELRQQMIPYPEEYFQGRGIVLTVGSAQMPFAKVNLKMIELSGTQLPVQIWYSSSQQSLTDMIELRHAAPKLNSSVCCFETAQCSTLKHAWQLNASHIYRPGTDTISYKHFLYKLLPFKHFPYKPAAILSATFAEVLFLDSDSYVVRDPDYLFQSDPMYLKFGALFYPDAIISRQHMAVWKTFNTSCGQDEFELDSAALLVDKRRVWKGLYMTKLMNDQHKSFYKHVTDGDKDTFRLGFRYMHVKYYLVMIPCSTGPFDGTHFTGMTLCKTDSLAQHIFINHMHLFKYGNLPYTSENLRYTRIGLGDSNNHSFLFQHCSVISGRLGLFHIDKQSNRQVAPNGCYNRRIPLTEIEHYVYSFDEPLLSDQSRSDRVVMSETNNLMPHFVENFLSSRRLLLGKR